MDQVFKAELQTLQAWLQTAAGKALLTRESQALDRLLPGLFGYHLLQQSVMPDVCLYRESPIRHCMELHASLEDSAVHPRIVLGRPEALPFAENSLDVLLLHHSLDMSLHPHLSLREAVRVLIPGGHLVIVTFNPYGRYGWRKWPGIARGRLSDWLVLLGCRVEHYEGHFVRRWQQPWLRHFQQGLAGWLGSFQIVVATKEVRRITPIRPRWHQRPLVAVPLAKPSMRNRQGD
ncbi:class I SAM-dependent methyltransferase [Balneatrix alpica]|uniref:class I SAM-dependent methyltransferase n=1 Tax=Balneatrix alpica TaxID=75684 RepID=UPI002738D6D7|nr:methyltransferase domain-containing protein [Balneatrix alpica]